MTDSTPTQMPLGPRWDGHQVFFDVEDGDRRVSCVISKMALEDLGGRRLSRSEDALDCFEAARERITAVAIEKARARPEGTPGRLHVWSEDLDDTPTDDAPAAAADGGAG